MWISKKRLRKIEERIYDLELENRVVFFDEKAIEKNMENMHPASGLNIAFMKDKHRYVFTNKEIIEFVMKTMGITAEYNADLKDMALVRVDKATIKKDK